LRGNRALQSAAYELEKKLATDHLKKGLGKRSQREELVERNILLDSTAAPGIQSQQKELQKHMRADSLNEKIAHRPGPEELRQRSWAINPYTVTF